MTGTKGKGAPDGAFMDNNPNQPTDRQVYLGERLGLDIPAVVKLNKAHGREAVTFALAELHGFPPAGEVENVYPWVATVAAFKNAENGQGK